MPARKRPQPLRAVRTKASKTGKRDGIQQLVSFQLRQLVTVFIKGAARIYADQFGLTLNEWRLVALVHAAGALSSGQLASRAQFDPGLTSRLIAELVARGYFQREVDSRDNRGISIRLTPAGEDLVAKVLPVARERNRRLLSCLTPAERKALKDAIRKLNAQARKMLDEDRAAAERAAK